MKKNSKLLQALEWLENERKKDDMYIQYKKDETISEVTSWNKSSMFPQKPKLSFLDKIKKALKKR